MTLKQTYAPNKSMDASVKAFCVIFLHNFIIIKIVKEPFYSACKIQTAEGFSVQWH